MAAHSNRSPSPISSRPNNPNSRTPEIHSATRRSFNGLTNPRKLDSMTPANSPSVLGSCLRNSEEKENNVMKGQMLKASKLQSPAKGFMAPTISAASKFTPSPRKRALVERNEAVRTSISLSDGKAMFLSNVPERSEPKPVQAPKPSKRVTFLDVPQDSENGNESLPDSVISDLDSLEIEPGLKNDIFCSPVLPSKAPRYADPSMAPYDPKTNYLSPRPRFLYYKPNPRIEVFLNKEKETGPNEFIQLEDDDGSDGFVENITSDNFSKVSLDSEMEKLEDITSVDMVPKFVADDICLYDEVSEREELKIADTADIVEGLDFSEDDLIVSEDEEKMEAITSTDDMVTMGSEETSEVENLNFVQKNEKRSWSVSRLACFSAVMTMLLMAACVSVSVTQSPSMEELTLFKDMSFSDLGKLYHQSRVVATTNARTILETCLSYVSQLANELIRDDNKPGPLKYVNISDLQEGVWNDADEDDDELDYEVDDSEEEAEYWDGAYEHDEDFEDEVNEEEDDVLEIEEIVTSDTAELDSDTLGPQEIVPSSSVIAPQNEVSEIEEIVPADLSESDSEHLENTQTPEEIVSSSIISSPQDQESEIVVEKEVVQSEIVGTEKFDSEVSFGSDATLMDQESLTDAEPSEEIFLTRYAVGIFSFIAALVAAVAVFMHQYKRIQSFQVDKSAQRMHQEEKTEADGSPSEVSSFTSKKGMTRGASEAQSLEMKARKHYSRRESLASSSSEFTMASYGSFTTFEKIPVKKANGEDEIITPVRRSSRIRTSQFTSQ